MKTHFTYLLILLIGLHVTKAAAMEVAIDRMHIVVVSSGTVTNAKFDTAYLKNNKSLLITLDNGENFRLLLNGSFDLKTGSVIDIYYLPDRYYGDDSAVSCAIRIRKVPDRFLFFWEKTKILKTPIHLLGKQEKGCNFSFENQNLNAIKTADAWKESRPTSEESRKMGSDVDLYSADILLFIDRKQYFDSLIRACSREFHDSVDVLKKHIAKW